MTWADHFHKSDLARFRRAQNQAVETRDLEEALKRVTKVATKLRRDGQHDVSGFIGGGEIGDY